MVFISYNAGTGPVKAGPTSTATLFDSRDEWWVVLFILDVWVGEGNLEKLAQNWVMWSICITTGKKTINYYKFYN